MIERFYAIHLKNVLDASAINGRKQPTVRKAPGSSRPAKAA
jgi:hypothetical protein